MSRGQTSTELVALPLFGPIASFEPFFTSYLLPEERTALIDPGPTVCLPQLLSKIGEANIKPESLAYILLTHIHIDHAGGVGDLTGYASGARVVVHPSGVKHLANPERLWQASLDALGEVADKYGRIKPVPEMNLISATDGVEIDLGQRSLKVIFTPGHARHHISFWNWKQGELFVGDAVGVYHPAVDMITPGTPPPFDLPKALESLEKLASLAPETICYSHGGCVSARKRTIDRHRKQLLIWKEVISKVFRRRREDIFKILLHEDGELGKLMKIKKPEFERETFFLANSVDGFIDYFKSGANSS